MSDKVNYNRMVAEYFSTEPTLVNGVGNYSFWYYRKKLFQLIYSRFEFVNFPIEWDKDYFRNVLFEEGLLSVCTTDIGVLALRGGYYGINVYEKPTMMTIANPVLGTFQRRIGVDCEPLYFEYFNKGYSNMEQLVRRYAVLLAQIDGSLNVSLMNSRVAMAFTSNSKTVVKTLQKMYDEVTSGKPSVFALVDDKDIDMKSQPFFNNVKNTYVGNELLLTKQTIINEFCTEIGIYNANTQKKERLITDEANANNEMTDSLISLWVDNMNECFKRIETIFPNIKTRVKIREPKKEVYSNELT